MDSTQRELHLTHVVICCTSWHVSGLVNIPLYSRLRLVQFTHFWFRRFYLCKFTICYEGGFDSRLTNVFLFSAYSFPTTKHTVCKSMGEYALLVYLIVQRTRQFVESVFLVVFFFLLAFFYASFSCILRVLLSMYFRALNY